MIRAGIIGTGNIGTDLLIKILKTDFISPVIFAGRRMDSDGIRKANSMGVQTTDQGINYFINNPKCCEIVYDCTNSEDAKFHSSIFKKQGIKVIDLTPSKVGILCVPSINSNSVLEEENVNMITCGGQASIPILYLISKHCEKIEYAEVVSQISSSSAGISTRINIDSYVHTTEKAIKEFTGCHQCKVILNVNPAVPCVDMQTTMFLKASGLDFESLVEEMYKKIKEIREYIPHYELIIPPTVSEDVLLLSVKVKGSGDYLPEYAGNLDIINCAAIEVTKKMIGWEE